MSGMQNISFGSLTKSIHQLNFGELDVNKDGIITQEEVDKAAEKNGLDVLDISTIDKDADTKVTQSEYDLWQQEAEISAFLETLKKQAYRELAGQDSEDIKTFTDKLTEYSKTFEEEYLDSHKNKSEGMAAEFNKKVGQKYAELKKSVLSNTKTAIVSRVVTSVIDDFAKADQQAGGTFLSLIGNDTLTLSDNAKRLLSNQLSKEANKFVKKYDGKKLEADLTLYLKTYLAQTDKEKLADTIGVWEKGKQELANMSEEIKFAQLKSKAKTLLQSALENDMTLKIGDISVRSESIIPAALGQYKNSASLQDAVDKAISELSNKTHAQEIKEKDEELKAAAAEEISDITPNESDNKNIFM